MENTKIGWCHNTFNPWWGCQRISEGCGGSKSEGGCYAEVFALRLGKNLWGPTAPRQIASEKYWQQPIKWNARAKKTGGRERVFCASMADVFEMRPDLEAPRARLFRLIEATPYLDWLLLTKRPENMRPLAELAGWKGNWPYNVWAGATAETTTRAGIRIPVLLDVPARTRFLSCEPLLEKIDLLNWIRPRQPAPCAAPPARWDDFPWPEWVPSAVRSQIQSFWSDFGRTPKDWINDIRQQWDGDPPNFGDVVQLREMLSENRLVEGRFVHAWNNIARIVLKDGSYKAVSFHAPSDKARRIHWVICGGESGPRARPFNIQWARSLKHQCEETGTSFFFKQFGSNPINPDRVDVFLKGKLKMTRPVGHPDVEMEDFDRGLILKPHKIIFNDASGSNIDEWPEDLCVQQFPR